ncbi:MAG: DUF3048 domain-containing protein [Acidimicrobiales bacterium]
MGSGGRCGDGRRLSRGRSTEARPRRSRQRRGIVALRAALGLLATGCLLAGCAAGGSGTANKAAHHKKSSGVPTTPPSTAVAGGPDCPLTGTPAPHGVVPKRSALAVKVDNYPAARPQTGLTAADVVFEEPVEGGITRYVAIFQCRGAPEVGDVRSARNIDIGILGQLGHPLLVHVGGIQPVIADILSSPIQDFELGNHTTIIQHVPGRFAPYDTYTSTGAVWHLRSTADQPPQPLFAYSKVVPAGTPVKSVSIPFSRYSPVVWRYDAATRKFLRFYDSSPDKLSNGVQNSASNVIVQIVNVTYGPWLENSTGGLEVQANLYTHASGKAIVFRDGVEIAGRWSRTNLAEPTSFATASGQRITMQPGNTWVELVPAPVSVTATP